MAWEAGMTKSSLNPDQRRTVEIIEALDFGVIERLLIRGGLPCYEKEPRIVQKIKLAPEPERQLDRRNADLSLNKAFENLFDQLGRLRDGFVDVEVQHSRPFRLVLERRYEELL
jgi:hypothetical protein